MKFFKRFIKIDSGKMAILALVLLVSSCESMSLPSLPSKQASATGTRENPVYIVMEERAPFYLENAPKGRRGSKGHPFLYLPKGTLVKVVKNKVPYSDVLLTNGMKGWMPIVALAPQMVTTDGPGSNVVPVSGEAGNTGAGATPPPTNLNPEKGVKLPSYN